MSDQLSLYRPSSIFNFNVNYYLNLKKILTFNFLDIEVYTLGNDIMDLVWLRHLTMKCGLARYCTIQCSVIDHLLCSLYCKQKVDKSGQASSSKLELNNILSGHDCKCP